MALNKIIEALYQERDRVDRERDAIYAALHVLTSDTTKKPTTAPATAPKLTKTGKVRKKRNLSPEARQRIADAVKARWARQKGKK